MELMDPARECVVPMTCDCLAAVPEDLMGNEDFRGSLHRLRHCLQRCDESIPAAIVAVDSAHPFLCAFVERCVNYFTR